MHRIPHRSTLAIACATALMSLAAAPVAAAEWTGAQSNDWFDQNNWSSGSVPGSVDDVIIDVVAPAPIVRDDPTGAFTAGLVVGDLASGQLTIQDAGTLLSAGNTVIGRNAGASGTLIVDGVGSAFSTIGVSIGSAGSGTLLVRNGGVMDNSGVAVIADGIGSTGAATVDGGSWASALGFKVGDEGIGSLDVRAGGQIGGGSFALGFEAGSVGVATVTGTGSLWSSLGDMTVGFLGSGELTVGDNARVEVAGLGNVGLFAGSQGALTVASGASLATAASLTVGNAGNGALTVEGGASVASAGLFIGVEAESAGDAVVSAAALATGSMIVGNLGTGTLTILDGGTVTSDGVSIGDQAQSSGVVSVAGPGSALANAGFLLVGNEGNGTLAITGGGSVVTQDSAFIGGGPTGSGSATIDGTGSSWSVGSFFDVGSSGVGVLAIGNGGRLDTAGTAAIGFQEGSSGAVSVSGAGSIWDASLLSVGFHGIGGLSILEGGVVNNDSFGSLGDQAGSLGTATIDGSGSAWNNLQDLRVGNFGSGHLVVRNGGAVSNTSAFIGRAADSISTVTVEGEGSRWSNDGTLHIGDQGSGTLTIRNGGAVTATGSVSLGRSGGGTGSATVDGTNSLLRVEGGMLVGEAGGAGALTVQGGAQVEVVDDPATNDGLLIGNGAGAVGMVLVDDASLSAEQVDVGFAGGVGALTVRNGAAVASETGGIGNGDAVVEGVDSSWNTASGILVGAAGGSTGRLVIRDGATVTNGIFAEIGGGPDGTGIVTVEGVGSRWNTGSFLVIGTFGTGVLNIDGGGEVVSDGTADVGLFAEGTAAVTVSGVQSRWAVADALRIGRGGAGTLTIGSGARVSAGSVEVASNAGAIGILNIGAAAGEAAAGAGTLDTPTLAFGDGSGTINFNHTGTGYDFDAAISGAGALNVLAGTTRLTAVNSYLGATNVNGGTLLVDGTLTESSVSTAGGATFGGSGSVIGDVTIVDGATLAPGSGVGTLTVGSLALSGGSILDYELGQAGVVGGGVNDLVEVGSNLTLDGRLDVTDVGGFGAGVYRLMNYGGSLTDNGLEIGALPSNLQAGDLFVQTAVTGQVNLINSAGAILSFWDGGDATQHDNGIIEGGAGTWDADNRNWTQADGAINGRTIGEFAVFNGAAGAVTVQGEQRFTGLQFMTDGYALTAGSEGALRTDTAQTVIRVDSGVTARIAVPIVGSGGLVKTDVGTLVLEGEGAYTGGVVVDGGRLVGDAGNLLGDIRNEAVVEFAQGEDAVYGDAVTGAGALVKTGAGALALTGSNAYTGGTTVAAGTLRIGNGGSAGSLIGDVAVAAGARLAFDRSDDSAFGGTLSGDGALDKLGAGTLLLTSDSAAFSGAATVASGTLRMLGTLGGDLDVAAGARLTGDGRLGDVVVAGTIAPDAVGTLHIGGDYAQSAGAVFAVEVDAAGASGRLEIAGTADLGGAVQVSGVAAPAGTRYTLLTAAGGISGAYSLLDVSAVLTPFLSLTLNYSADAVFLDVSRSALAFGAIGLTRNQRATGEGLDSLPESNALISAISVLEVPQALAAFDALSGEAYASTAGALVEESRFLREAVTDRMGRLGDAAADASTDGLGAWAEVYGHRGETESDGNAARIARDGDGLLLGADLAFDAGWRLGATAGFGESRIVAGARASRIDSQDRHLGVYAGTRVGGFGLNLGAAYTRHTIDAERGVAFAGLVDAAQADYDAETTQVFAEAGYRFERTRTAFEPFLALAHVEVDSESFTERSGAAALAIAGQDTATGFATLGIKARIDGGDWSGARWRVQGSLGWRHAFGDTQPTSAHRFGGGDAFVVAGAPLATDALVADLALDLRLSDSTSVGIAYSGQFDADAEDHAVQGRVRWQF